MSILSTLKEIPKVVVEKVKPIPQKFPSVVLRSISTRFLSYIQKILPGLELGIKQFSELPSWLFITSIGCMGFTFTAIFVILIR